jgi:signal transduction histidine kinase/ligand-binding sensor domain-containing protein/CheY-like chemotaxis protein
MYKYPKIFILISTLLFLVISFVYAQSPDYKFRHLTTKDGLPSNFVNSIEKDSNGFMWFGTENGLARYDGYEMKVYKIPEDSAISNNSQVITDVFEDGEGNLWIGSQEMGLLLFDRITETFVSYINNPDEPNSLSHNSVNVIFQDRKGVIWVGTNGGGLNRFDSKGQKFIAFVQNLEDENNNKNSVTALYEDRFGNFWVGTRDEVYIFDRLSHSFSPFDLRIEIPDGDFKTVNYFLEDENNTLWIATRWGLLEYIPIKDKINHYLSGDLVEPFTIKGRESYLSNIYLTALVRSNFDKNKLWISTWWGLNIYDKKDDSFSVILTDPEDPDALASTQLFDMLLDEDDQLWIATRDAGIEILDTKSNPFSAKVMIEPGKDIYFSAASFLLDSKGILWVGAIDEGFFQYDQDMDFLAMHSRWGFEIGKPYNNRSDCIYEDSQQNIWHGFYQWGLILFDRDNNSFTKVELKREENVPEPTKFDNILEDKEGILWVGTNAGLYTKDLQKGVLAPAIVIRHEELSKAHIIRLYLDDRNNLWISTRTRGLFCLYNKNRDSLQFVRYLEEQDQIGYSGNYINALCNDQDGNLWIGSDKGLIRFNYPEEKFEPDPIFNRNYAGNIIQIHCDGRNNLWLFHAEKGLMRYNPHVEGNNSVKIFDTRDGLPFDKYNTVFSYINAFYQSQDGRLFLSSGIGTGDGFFFFHPDSIKDNLSIPDIYLTDFQVGNEGFILDSNINLKQHITLEHDENFFSFEFAALNFLKPEKNQYAYYLEGFEDDWFYSGNRRFANYTGVPPGEYTFHVKGSNNDGYWNEEGTSVQITVLPPLWKTWWAYVIYGIFLISIIFSIFYYYLRRQRLLQKLALEQVEAEKLKELDGLKTRFFTNISHEFRTPLTLILGPVQQLLAKISDPRDKQNLSIIQQNAHRLKELVNQLLSLSKLESGKMVLQATEVDLVQFVKNCMQSFESLAGHKKIDLSFTADQDIIAAYIDKEKMMQVMNNLLSNAFKYTTEGGSVLIQVGQLDSWTVGSKITPLSPPSSGDNESSPTLGGGRGGIVISISDTGKGISPDHLAHIFDRFYQADDSISREQEGTGIGLAIAQEMVKLHGGEIEVESDVGVGSTFRIYLPLGMDHLKPEELETSLQSVSESEGSPGSTVSSQQFEINMTSPPVLLSNLERGNRGPGGDGGEAPLLLIVEDNPDMRTFIRGYFEDSYQVLEAENGEEGLTTAIEQIPDVIVSDVMMPKMDGYAFCQKLKTDEKTSHIPVILLTARATKESRMEGLETGADDFITKPFDGEELQVRVQNLVDQRKKLSEHFRKKFELIAAKPSDAPLSRDEKFLIKAQSVVEANLSNPDYGVENFASDMALSRYHLHRKLKALVEQSTTEFIRTIRLTFAINLLKNRAGTISEIAYDAGFNNPTYFTISFKKKYGISPSEYLDRLEKK